MTRPADPLFRQWADAARAAPVADLARARGLKLRGGVEKVGPCPAPGCGGKDRFGVNTRKNVFGCRQCGVRGGAIDLVMLCDGVDFVTAAQILNGCPPPNGAASGKSQEELAAIEAERCRKRAESDAQAASFSEAERERCYKWWCGGKPAAGSPVEAYLALRGVSLPPRAALRFRPSFRLYDDREGEDGILRPVPVHEGPAMFAAIIGPDGHFSGLHITWLDLDAPDGKALVANAKTGELAPAKKIRGTMAGGRIELGRVLDPARVIVGEGIENTLSVRDMLLRRGENLERTAFWAAINLGNLGGKHLGTVAHPTERNIDSLGRAQPKRVPSAVPDLAAPAIPIPDSADEVVTLGDGDSEPVLTRLAHERAAARWARPGRTVRPVFAPPGTDFNTLLRGAGT